MSHAAQKSSLFGKPKSTTSATSSSGSTSKITTSSAAPAPVVKPVSKTACLTASTNKGVAALPVLSEGARAKKIEEAKENSEAGMKCLKTSVFQWSPDHLAAAPYFEYSSNAYKAAGELKLARLMMLQSADSHDAAGCQAAAACSFVKSAVIAHTMDKYDLSSADYVKSAELWGVSGDLEKCSEMLSKAAKELEDDNPAAALDLHKRACDMLCPSNTPLSQIATIKPRVIEIFKDALGFMLRQTDSTTGPKSCNPLKDGTALKFSKTLSQIYLAFEMESSMGKALCGITMIQLSMGDIVGADQTFLEHLSDRQYIVSHECRLAESFLLALKTRDPELLEKAQKDTAMGYLERDIQQLARKLSVFKTSKESKAEKQVRQSADQLARDMKEMMAMAPPVAAHTDKEEEEEGGSGLEWESEGGVGKQGRGEEEEEEEEREVVNSRHSPPAVKEISYSPKREEEDEDDGEDEVDLS